MSDLIAVAGTIVKIDDIIIAKITSIEIPAEIAETEITSAEDTVGQAGRKINEKKFLASAVQHSIGLEGIAINTDTGQSDLEDAKETGKIVTIEMIDQDGYGYALSGQFNSFSKQGAVSGVYKWNAQFRANTKTQINPTDLSDFTTEFTTEFF